MPIRWSARQVAESLDELERLLKDAEPVLNELVQKTQQALNTPNLPEYMGQPLGWFKQKTLDYLSGQYQRIKRVREYIPPEALAKEKAEFEKLLAYFNGDREKASLAMELGKPNKKEVPKEQLSLLGGDGEGLEKVVAEWAHDTCKELAKTNPNVIDPDSGERQSYENLSDEEMMEVDNSIVELIEAGKSEGDIAREISENYGLEKDQALTEAVQEGIKFYPEVRGE